MDENDQTKSIDLVAYGGTIKALGDGRIGGYLVMWGDKQQTDLEGEYFTPETELMWSGEETRPHLYNHGLDETLNGKTLGNGWRKVKVDEVGLWVETQLDLRDEYEKAIYGLVTKSKLGLSSGTASHMVIRENGYIKRWPIVEGSTTPTPAEPRIIVEPIKSAQLNSFKSLCESEPATGNGRRSESRPEAGGKPTKSKPRTKSNGATKMDQLLEAIRQLVPNLTEEQLTQLAAVLQLHGGTVAPEPEAMMAEEDDEPYPMQATRSTGKYRNPKNAPKGVAQIVAETMKAMGVTPQQPAQQQTQQLTQEQLTQITEVLKAAGVAPQAQDPNGAKTPARPPYNFTPANPQPEQDKDKLDATKNVAILRFGETPEAIKSFTRELYGDDYDKKRLHQHSAYGKYARYGVIALTSDDQRILKAVILTPGQIKGMVLQGIDMAAVKTEMSEIIDTLGGFMTPEDMRLDMIERLPDLSSIRQYADVSPTTSDVMTKVKVTGGNDQYQTPMRVTWVGDTPAQNQADTAPTFGLEKTPIHIAKVTVPVPMTLLEDTAFPLTQKLSEWAANTYAVDENTQFLVGNAIAKPEGILPGQTNLNTRLAEVAAGSTSAITNGDVVIQVQYSVAQQYWAGSRWTMQRNTAMKIRQLKAGDGHYLWQDGLQAGQPPMLLGFPVDLNESMPAIASNAYPLLFGNHREGYQIADRIGMSMLRDEITEAEQDIVKFMFRRRLGGQVKGEWAYAVLKMATS